MYRRLLSILGIAIVLVACSWITRFAVTNDSPEPILLKYSAEINLHPESKARICPIEQWGFPEVTTHSLGRFNTGAWRQLSAERYRLDREECSVEMTLRPGESVSVARAGTYTGHDPERGIPGRLNFLSVKSKNGEISLKGWEIAKPFEKVDDTLYVYRYK